MAAKSLSRDSLELFTAHEAMQLDLEEALTRKVGGKFYTLSAHTSCGSATAHGRSTALTSDGLPRHRQSHRREGRGLGAAAQVGPSMKNDELKELLAIINPQKEEGRVVIITRYGAGKVDELLSGHIKAVKESGIPVVWQCDAVHGNGVVASNKYKTRKMDDIVKEILEVMAVHKKNGSVLGGIHLEMTGQPVTECLGGVCGITEEGLTKNYETYCDPRLNYSQAMEAAFKVANEMPSAERAAKRARK